jgi:hypothetical protein
MSEKRLATTRDLFQVCLRYFSQPVASVASELLFWSQCACNKLRGRDGFFKEDAELVQTIGKHASSIRRALAPICAKVGEDRPEALFEMAHGPKPRQRSGRVRWLFRKPRGDEMIREALCLAEARQEVRSASINRRGKAPPVGGIREQRSAQNERILYQKNLSESQSEALSSKQERREKIRSESVKEKSGEDEQLTRLVGLWNRACNESGNATLEWRPSDVRRSAQKLIELIQVLRLTDMSDADLLKRLRLMAGPLDRFSFAMGDRFMQYNSHGLMIESFAGFGQKLWRVVEKELEDEQRRRTQWDHLKSLKKETSGR